MRKVLAGILAICMLVSICPVFALAADAGKFDPIELNVTGQGNAGGNLRFVVTIANFPTPPTENSLTGTKVTGTLTHKTTNAVVNIDSTVVGNEMRGDSMVLVVAPQTGAEVKDIDYTTNNEYIFKLTLSPGTGEPIATASPKPSTSVDDGTKKDGVYLYLAPESFEPSLGTWVIESAGDTAGGTILRGATDEKPEGTVNAAAEITLPKDGTYYVWARSKDYPNDRPGIRFAQLKFGDTLFDKKFGTHGNAAYTWELAGSAECKQGKIKVELVDASAFYARFETICVTDDKAYTPPADNAAIVAAIKKYAAEVTGVEPTPAPTPKPTRPPVENKLAQAVMLFVDNATAFVKGEKTQVDKDNADVKPFVTDNDRTLVPVRFIAESFGAKVDFDDATQLVTVTSGSNVVKLVLGQSEIDINGTKTALEEPANTYNDRTFIPLRAMVEAMGKVVFWDDRGLILITDHEMFDVTEDKELIDSAVAGFGGESIDFAVVDDDKKEYLGTIGSDDYMLDYYDPNELIERGGVKNVLKKLNDGKDVTIGYLGGSITLSGGWSSKATAWFQAQYPNSNITMANASVNGTGADFGACRVTSALLEPSNPDVVFVEYAVNGGEPIHMEGIFRQIWQHNPETDIVVVYTISSAMIANYKSGNLPPVTTGFDKVAEYYNIPAIYFGYEIVDLMNQDKLTFQANAPVGDQILFSKDGVHPTGDGAILYAGAIARSFIDMDKSVINTAKPHVLPEPMYANNWEKAKVVQTSQAKFEGEWFDCVADMDNATAYGTGFNYTGGNLNMIKGLMPTLKGTKQAGASVTIKFKGTTFGFLDAGGPFAGQLKVSIDGAEPVIINRFTVHSQNIRQQYIFMPAMEDKEHTIVMTLDSTLPDKSIVADSKTNPEPYKANEFYLGSFLVIGDVLEVK